MNIIVINMHHNSSLFKYFNFMPLRRSKAKIFTLESVKSNFMYKLLLKISSVNTKLIKKLLHRQVIFCIQTTKTNFKALDNLSSTYTTTCVQ